MNRIFQLLTAGLLSCLQFTAIGADSPAPPVFQMRLVVDTATEDSEEMVMFDKGKVPEQKETLHVQKKVLIDQSHLKSARVIKDKQLGTSQIEIRFNDEGTKRLAEVTRNMIGKRLAIVIRGQLYSAPNVMTEISGGVATINGSFSEEEARDLAARITDSLKKK